MMCVFIDSYILVYIPRTSMRHESYFGSVMTFFSKIHNKINGYNQQSHHQWPWLLLHNNSPPPAHPRGRSSGVCVNICLLSEGSFFLSSSTSQQLLLPFPHKSCRKVVLCFVPMKAPSCFVRSDPLAMILYGDHIRELVLEIIALYLVWRS
jgi:hypothetical protein